MALSTFVADDLSTTRAALRRGTSALSTARSALGRVTSALNTDAKNDLTTASTVLAVFEDDTVAQAAAIAALGSAGTATTQATDTTTGFNTASAAFSKAVSDCLTQPSPRPPPIADNAAETALRAAKLALNARLALL